MILGMTWDRFVLLGYQVWIIPCFILGIIYGLWENRELTIRQLLFQIVASWIPGFNIMCVLFIVATGFFEYIDTPGTILDKKLIVLKKGK